MKKFLCLCVFLLCPFALRAQTQLASDTFQRTNENPLGNNNWTTAPGAQPLQIVSDAVEGTATSTDNVAYFSSVTWPSDQYAEIKVGPTSTANSFVGLALRVTTSGTSKNYYGCRLRNLGTNLLAQVYKYNNNTFSSLSSITTAAVSSGDVLHCEVIGAPAAILFKDVTTNTTFVSYTDNSPFTSGAPGLIVQPITSIANEVVQGPWTAGSTGGTPPPPPTVTSVFGRGGDVTAQTGDYSFSQLSGTASDGQLANAYSGIGSCTAGQFVNALTRNTAPTCATPAGGSGGVTNFSSGNLAPLFTTSVANSTTTPALSFSLSTVANNTFFGNHSGSTATPSFIQPALTDFSGRLTIAQFPTTGAFTVDGSGNNVSASLTTGAISGTSVNVSGSPQITDNVSHASISFGTGAKSGACTTASLFLRTDGGVGTTLYICDGGTWNPVTVP